MSQHQKGSRGDMGTWRNGPRRHRLDSHHPCTPHTHLEIHVTLYATLSHPLNFCPLEPLEERFLLRFRSNGRIRVVGPVFEDRKVSSDIYLLCSGGTEG